MTLIELKRKYPSCYYDEDTDTICIDVNEDPQTVAEDANELIEDYYDGDELPIHHPSGNPELEEVERVTGREYIMGYFDGDYNEAFEQA